MKQIFFLAVIAGSGAAILGYFVWKLIQSVAVHVRDTRDSHTTKIASSEIRERLQQENAERLDNGCDHRFGQTLGGFPPFACRTCGLEKTKPAGPCDHVWRINTDGHPGASCELCGKTYRRPLAEV